MEVVLLDGTMFSDSYESRLTLKRFVRYARIHEPQMIAVSHLDKRNAAAWDHMKVGFSSAVRYMETRGLTEKVGEWTATLTEQGLQIADRLVLSQPGAAAWIRLRPQISWRYIVFDMMSSPAFALYHHCRTFPDHHSIFIFIRVRNDGQRIFN